MQSVIKSLPRVAVVGIASVLYSFNNASCEDDFLHSNKLAFSSSSSFRSQKQKKAKTSAKLLVISGTCHPSLAKEVCDILDVKGHNADIARFADGEVKMEFDTVRGGNLFIIQPCGKPVSDSAMELLLAISAAKRAGAKKVTAVIPYFPFKHHRRGMAKSSKHNTKFLESVAMDFAKMLDMMGTDAVLTVDLQRPGQGQEACFFDNSIPLENVVTTKLVTDYFIDNIKLEGKIVVISPNYECLNKAMKYETRFREGYPDATVSLNALIHAGVSAHKQSTGLEVLGQLEVEGCHVVIVDDIVDTGETISFIANKVKKDGAKRVFVVASHGVFTETAMNTIDKSPIEKLVITNSLPLVSPTSDKVVQVSIAPLLARAIWAEHFKSRKVDEDYLIEFH